MALFSGGSISQWARHSRGIQMLRGPSSWILVVGIYVPTWIG